MSVRLRPRLVQSPYTALLEKTLPKIERLLVDRLDVLTKEVEDFEAEEVAARRLSPRAALPRPRFDRREVANQVRALAGPELLTVSLFRLDLMRRWCGKLLERIGTILGGGSNGPARVEADGSEETIPFIRIQRLPRSRQISR